MDLSLALSLYFRLFKTAVHNKQMFYVKICKRLDSNLGALVSEATALPIDPLALSVFWISKN